MNKKLVAVPLLVAIGLSICGFAYSHWTSTVYINGKANTGWLMLGFTQQSPAEPPSVTEWWMDLASVLHAGEYLGKDVANASASLTGPITCPQTGLSGFNELDLTVNNAYPGYLVHTTFNLLNLGTIPVDFKYINVTGEKRTSTGTVVYNLLYIYCSNNHTGYLFEDINKNDKIDDGDVKVISIYISNSLPVQYDPHGTPDKREIDLDFEQAAEQCHTYTIHVTLFGIQWNKVNEP